MNDAVISFSGWNPSGSASRFHKLRTSSEAPISSIKESATCAPTSAWRILERLPPAERHPAKRSPRNRSHAGSSPVVRAASKEMPIANSSTRASIRAWFSRVMASGEMATNARSSTHPNTQPAAHPRMLSVRVSVSICSARRARPAPNAARMAISFARAAPRASSKFARFAQASAMSVNTDPNSSHEATRES